MHRFTCKSLFLTVLIMIFASPLARGAEGTTVISKDQLRENLTKPDVIVIDVRTPNDWDASQWKIQGAQRRLPTEAKQWMSEYAKDKTIVLYCA